MHQVIQAYLSQFIREHDLGHLSESQQFERFVNYCVISQDFPDQFDLGEVSTQNSDPSIDGAAVLIDDQLVLTAEDAGLVFKRAERRRNIRVRYYFCEGKRSEGFDSGDMLKFGNGVLQLFTGGQSQSDDVLNEFLAIHEVVISNLARLQHRPDCLLSFATTGVWREENNLRAKVIEPVVGHLTGTSLFNGVEFLPIDREKLIHYWTRSTTRVEAIFPVKGMLPLPEIARIAEAYLTLAPADEFVRRVLSDSEGRIRSSVFEQNVRAFLGEDNDVNKNIQLTLLDHSRHDRFAILNNGITIVAPDVKVTGDKVSINDYQIVNGCQTCHVLHRNQALLSDKVWITVKVIEADDIDIVGQVVEATNSQSQVEKSQFFSIHPYVQRIQRYFDSFDTDELRERRVFFERRTMQYSGEEIGKLRIFDIYKLARAYAAMFLNLPHLAARYPTQVFEEQRPSLFQTDHREHAYYTAALALYRLELSFANKYVPSNYQSYKWHILMILKILILGDKTPNLASRKLDESCDKIIQAIAVGGKPSAPPFNEAISVIDQVGTVSRDRRKGKPYTEELQSAALALHRVKPNT